MLFLLLLLAKVITLFGFEINHSWATITILIKIHLVTQIFLNAQDFGFIQKSFQLTEIMMYFPL
jgi:hypothetical protein